MICCQIVLKIYLIVLHTKNSANIRLKRWLINMEIFIFSEPNHIILAAGIYTKN